MVRDKNPEIQHLYDKYPHIYFHNVIRSKEISNTNYPAVLTVNPDNVVNWGYMKLQNIPPNLMYIRVNTNTWNISIVHGAVHWYVSKKVPVVLLFVAYKNKDSIPGFNQDDYYLKDGYWRIKFSVWILIMSRFKKDPLVYSCGQEGLSDECEHCGNCVREYFNTMERLNEILD